MATEKKESFFEYCIFDFFVVVVVCETRNSWLILLEYK